MLTPNAHRADGQVITLTASVFRRRMKAAREFLDSRLHFDFSDAVVSPDGRAEQLDLPAA
ncbi:hypothetical protein [Streptomyces sp. NPDC050848]|uniref:hypothetical protein n=1 Tax=Streptomyces sp. NPDC050848 TaxID=3155791 RepID=UPI003403D5CD